MYNKIQKQLEILNTKIGFFRRTKLQDHLKALEQIGELGSPYDVQYICRFVFSSNNIIAKKTASIIRKLLTKKEVNLAWQNLYNSCSFFFDYYHLDNDNMFGKTEFKKIANFTPEEAAHLYGIASLNHNGYVREEALDYLKNLPTFEILPYILLRLNDWVPQVQTKAKAVLIKILPSINVVDLIGYYDLIEWLERTERAKLIDIQEIIFEQIRHSGNRAELFKVMQKVSFKERLLCWRSLTEEVVNDDTLIDKAITDPALEIRYWSALHLPKTINFKKRLSTLFADKSIRVRYAALKAIPKEEFEEYREFYETAIFDESKPIREYARFMLRLHGDDNVVAKYRKMLSEHKNKTDMGVIVGLAETAAEEDIGLIKTFVEHKNPNIRASALYTLNRLRVDDVDNLYIQGIQDRSAKVRNSCVSILQSGHKYLVTELKAILATTNIKSQKAVLKILRNYGALDNLYSILFALTQESEELQTIAWQYLISWHNQYTMRLWFSFSDDTYTETLDLLTKLRETTLNVPSDALYEWNDLPTIMKTIKK